MKILSSLNSPLTRRSTLLSMGMWAGGITSSQTLLAHLQNSPDAAPVSRTPRDVLTRLLQGNERFAKGTTQHAHQNSDWRMHLEMSQMPIATVIGCSDSRVPPELVFDQGLGDLFVIRVAGNIVTPDVIASLIFAVGHLKTQLVIVLGHGKCGAVTLAVNELRGKQMAPLGLQILTKSILPGLQSLPKDLEAGELVETAVEQNAKWSAEQLRQLPEVSEMRASGKLMVVAAAYDLTTGKVRVLDPV